MHRALSGDDEPKGVLALGWVDFVPGRLNVACVDVVAGAEVLEDFLSILLVGLQDHCCLGEWVHIAIHIELPKLVNGLLASVPREQSVKTAKLAVDIVWACRTELL